MDIVIFEVRFWLKLNIQRTRSLTPLRHALEPLRVMPPKKSATVLQQELCALRRWVLAHQDALVARDSERSGLRGRLRQHLSEEEKRWHNWLGKHDSRFEGDCAHLASRRRELDELVACAPARWEQAAPDQTPAKRARPALTRASPSVAAGTPRTPAALLRVGGMLSPTVAETIALLSATNHGFRLNKPAQ